MKQGYADLEIGLERREGGAYRVELRFADPRSEAEIPPARGEAPIDLEELLALELDPEAYGRALAAAVFADESVLGLFRQVKAAVASGELFLRLRLRVGAGAPELHALRWELLTDPETRAQLATSERTLFSRFMVSADWRPVALRPKAALQALVAVSAPADLADYRLADVDLDGEIARARASLEGIRTAVAGRDEPLTLERLVDGLRPGVDVLYLVCHGVLKGGRQPYLFLQDADGKTARVPGEELALRLAELPAPPRMVVLASCESAGAAAGPAAAGEQPVMSSLAPRLAEAGVPAVVAMQGRVSMETVAGAMPIFFTELVKDGRIDRAMAVARGAVRQRPDAWMPALYLRLKEGRIWVEPRLTRRLKLAIAAAAVVAALGAAWVIPRLGPPRELTLAETIAAATPRKSVAVLELENLTGLDRFDWLSLALAEWIASDLAAGQGLRVAGGDEVARASRGIATEGYLSVGRELGVDYLVAGSYGLLGEDDSALVWATVQLIDASSGEELRVERSTGSQRELFDLIDGAGRALRAELGASELTQSEKLAVMATFPADPAAARPYARGLAGLRSYDGLAAREAFEEAIAADPEHPLPHAALARALGYLGYAEEAEAAAAKAVEKSEFLGPIQKKVIEASYHEIAEDPGPAIAIYSELLKAHPDDLELGLRLAQVQAQAGKPTACLATLEALRRLPPPASEDPRLDLRELHGWFALGELEKAAAAARAGLDRLGPEGMVDLRAELRHIGGIALDELGDPEAGDWLRRAQRLFAEVGDRRGTANVLRDLAFSARRAGDLDGAVRLFERAGAIYGEMGNRYGAADVLTSIAQIALSRGDVAAANEVFERTLELYREMNRPEREALVLNEMGYELHSRGLLAAAEKKYAAALTLVSSVEDEAGRALTLTNIGEVRYGLGDLERARQLHEEALSANRAIGSREGEAYDLYRLGLVFTARGDTVVARQRLDAALAITGELGDTITGAMVQTALAELELATGDPAAARELAKAAEEVLGVAGLGDEAALAQTVVARALLAESDEAGAAEAAAGYRQRAEASRNPVVRLTAAITDARIEAAAGGEEVVDRAIGALESLAAEAREKGFVGLFLEARLAAGEIELAAGRSAAAGARLERLAAEAREQGFGLVAQRAGRS